MRTHCDKCGAAVSPSIAEERATEYLQVRLTPTEKATLQQRARAAGQTMARYLITRALS